MAKRRNRTFTALELETELNGVFYTSLSLMRKGAAGASDAGDAETAHEDKHLRNHLRGATALYRHLYEGLDDLYYRVGFRLPFVGGMGNDNAPATSAIPKPAELVASGEAFRNGTITLGDPLAMVADHIYRSISYRDSTNNDGSDNDNDNAHALPDLPPSTLLRSVGSAGVIQGLTDYNDQREGFAVLVTTQDIADKLSRMASNGNATNDNATDGKSSDGKPSGGNPSGGNTSDGNPSGGKSSGSVSPYACSMFIVLEGVDFAPDHCGIVFASAGGADTAVIDVMNAFYPLANTISTNATNSTNTGAEGVCRHWLDTTLHNALANALRDLLKTPHVQLLAGKVPAGYDEIDLDYPTVQSIMEAAAPVPVAASASVSASSVTPLWRRPLDIDTTVNGNNHRSAHQLLSLFLTWKMRWLRDDSLSISPRAFVHPTATLGKGCRIGSFVHIGAGVRMGENCVVAPSVHIEEGVVLGDFCEIGSGTTIHAAATLGNNVSVHNNVTIGGDGFGFRFIGGEFVKVPQVGSVVIGNNVEVGSGTTIDRGAIRDTVVGDGCKIDNQCHIAHNVVLGRSCVLAGKSAVAGSSTLGDYVMMGGASSVADHITVASGVRLYATASVSKNLTVENGIYVGTPAKLWGDWSRERVMLSFLAKANNSKILKNIIKRESKL